MRLKRRAPELELVREALAAILAAILALLSAVAYSCVGTGYTCDRGGVEIHIAVNRSAVDMNLVRANVVPVGQTWSAVGWIEVYETDMPYVLLYVFDNGIRIQIAVREFTHNGSVERCELWVDPESVDAKDVVNGVLTKLRQIGAIRADDETIRRIVELSRWGIAGSSWIEVGGGVGVVGVFAVRGCGGGPVLVYRGPRECTRGDADGDGDVDLEDVILVLRSLIDEGARLRCPVDLNGNGRADVGDAVLLLRDVLLRSR